MIRPFGRDHAEQAVELLAALSPASVHTAESLLYRQTSEPERARRRSWVALDGDDVVGFATAYRHWFGGEAGRGRIWVGVRGDRRRAGLGGELWETCIEHLRGARTYTVEVDDDQAGLRFVERRGFTQYDAEVISRLDLRAAPAAPTPPAGHSVTCLRDLGDRDAELFDFYLAAGGIPPGAAENRVGLEEWRRFIRGNPLLDEETSVVVLDAGARIVSLAWLLVDRRRRRAENEWTATLPPLRGRGLARLAKLASIGAAVESGIDTIVTGNDPDNLSMRALNRRLGYRELFVRRDLERPAAR